MDKPQPQKIKERMPGTREPVYKSILYTPYRPCKSIWVNWKIFGLYGLKCIWVNSRSIWVLWVYMGS